LPLRRIGAAQASGVQRALDSIANRELRAMSSGRDLRRAARRTAARAAAASGSDAGSGDGDSDDDEEENGERAGQAAPGERAGHISRHAAAAAAAGSPAAPAAAADPRLRAEAAGLLASILGGAAAAPAAAAPAAAQAGDGDAAADPVAALLAQLGVGGGAGGAGGAGGIAGLLGQLISGGAGGGGGGANADAAAGGLGALLGGDAGMLQAFADAVSGDHGHGAASAAAVAALRRLQLPAGASTDEVHAALPRQGSLAVAGIVGDIVTVPAGFGPAVGAGGAAAAIVGPLVIAEPRDAAGPLRNAQSMRGAIVVADRGVISFAAKALRLQAAGAAAVVIVQPAGSAWPYTMTDSKGEGAAGGLAVPVVMVRPEDGTRLAAAIASAASGAGAATAGTVPAIPLLAPRASLQAQAAATACSVCCDEFAGGCTLAFMPCQHAFHEQCLTTWLARRNTCPLCRAELPQALEGGGAGGGGGEAADAGRARWAADHRLQAEREAVAASWYS
jgi:hypothetical protein